MWLKEFMSFANGDPDCRNPGEKASDIWNPTILNVGSAAVVIFVPPDGSLLLRRRTGTHAEIMATASDASGYVCSEMHANVNRMEIR